MCQSPCGNILEISAVNKLKDALLRTACVEPDIRDNDKTPSWDGSLRVYRDQSLKKNNLFGLIPVQVKGQRVLKLQSNEIKFDVETADLRNYMNDGGAMFFVIQMKDFDHYKIYYASLLPFDLREILEAAGSQATKRIGLQHFPLKNATAMLRILFGFLDNKKKQGKLLPNVHSMQDLRVCNMEIEKFEFAIPAIGLTSPDDALESMLGNLLYIYAKPVNIDASFVVDKILPESFSMEKSAPITVNGEQLYAGFSMIKTIGQRQKMQIGSGITMEIEDGTLHLNFRYTGTLHEQIVDLKLLSALALGQRVDIGGYLIEGGKPSFTRNSSEEIQDRLSTLLKIAETLHKLHIKKDLQLDKLSPDECRVLDRLVDGMEGMPVPLSINGKTGAGILSVGNLKIMLFCKHYQDGAGNFITDFFATDCLRMTETGQPFEDGVSISPYVLMDADALMTIDNLVFEDMLPSICRQPYSAPYGERVTRFILELLKLYDACFPSDVSVLDIANRLLVFLIENEPDQHALHQINRLQIIKRQRPLQNDEIQQLIAMKNSGMPTQFQLAANVLLESFQEAAIVYDKLPPAEQQEFDGFPIAHLWEGHCNTLHLRSR